jgi:hypothetical protein
MLGGVLTGRKNHAPILALLIFRPRMYRLCLFRIECRVTGEESILLSSQVSIAARGQTFEGV